MNLVKNGLRPLGLKFKLAAARRTGSQSSLLHEPVTEIDQSIYDQDGLRTIHNHDFMRQPNFVRAYDRGIKAAGSDYNWHWRVHVGLWAAFLASKLPGDFVECGVNRGFLSS